MHWTPKMISYLLFQQVNHNCQKFMHKPYYIVPYHYITNMDTNYGYTTKQSRASKLSKQPKCCCVNKY